MEKNPLTVLESVYAVIVDRMKNPRRTRTPMLSWKRA